MSETEDQIVPTRAVAVILVNPEGHLLLQLRDGQARVSPHKWGLVGGGLDPEERPEAGARRELREETGLSLDGDPVLIHQGTCPASLGPGETQWWVFAAASPATKEDIVVGEGADIAFVAEEHIASLELGVSAERFVLPFVGSAEHQRLAEQAAHMRN